MSTSFPELDCHRCEPNDARIQVIQSQQYTHSKTLLNNRVILKSLTLFRLHLKNYNSQLCFLKLQLLLQLIAFSYPGTLLMPLSSRLSKNISSSSSSLQCSGCSTFPTFLILHDKSPEIWPAKTRTCLRRQERQRNYRQSQNPFFVQEEMGKAQNSILLSLSSNNHNIQTPVFYNSEFIKNMYYLVFQPTYHLRSWKTKKQKGEKADFGRH